MALTISVTTTTGPFHCSSLPGTTLPILTPFQTGAWAKSEQAESVPLPACYMVCACALHCPGIKAFFLFPPLPLLSTAWLPSPAGGQTGHICTLSGQLFYTKFSLLISRSKCKSALCTMNRFEKDVRVRTPI